MGENSGEGLFAVWILIVVVMLIVKGIRDYRVRRNLPEIPGNKRTTRKIALDSLKFFLGIKEKDDGDNPMLPVAEGDFRSRSGRRGAANGPMNV